MTTDEYWYWLCNIENVWQQDLDRLFSVFDSPEEIYKAQPYHFKELKILTADQIKALYRSRNEKKIVEKLNKLYKEGIRFVHKESSDFPERLKIIEGCPYSLYVKGQLPDNGRHAAGVVGARSCSRYGREMTEVFTKELAVRGVDIISGMAHGIDSISARAALDAGGRTFAVLGSGLNVIYPRENIELYYEIILKGGGIISEYPLDTPPLGWQFPHRNRLISGLSDILLVMEARKKSGTLITAGFALDQGKDVYALPGRVDDPLSEGCNKMIADGAGVLLSPEYLIEDFLGRYAPGSREKAEIIFTEDEQDIKVIYLLLDRDGMDINDIAAKAGRPLEDVAAALTELELKGLTKEISRGVYVGTK